MIPVPSEQQLREALSSAATAHHDYQSNFLGGSRDQQWAGWYSAYVLGRLGHFTTPTLLTGWLVEAPGEGDWSKNAADNVLLNIGTG